MQITYLRDASPTGRTCPTLYSTDRGTYLVQGKKVSDAVRRFLSGLGVEEEVVEVPARLLAEIADDTAFPADGGQGVATVLIRAVSCGTSSSSVSATSRGTFLVRGVRVTDPDALAAMDVPVMRQWSRFRAGCWPGSAPMLLDLAAIDVFFDEHFTRSAFRLEVLDRYAVDSDQGNVESYLAGGLAPSWADGSEWIDQLARERAEGRRNYRVHVLESPLNDYLRYECEWGYVYTSRAGEEIYILDTAETSRPEGLIDEDYYLLDDERVLVMRYDRDGRLLGGEPIAESETGRYLRSREIAMANAVPFGRYWADHPQFWRENWVAGESER